MKRVVRLRARNKRAGRRVPGPDQQRGGRGGGGNVEPEAGAEGERRGFAGEQEMPARGEVFDTLEARGCGEG